MSRVVLRWAALTVFCLSGLPIIHAQTLPQPITPAVPFAQAQPLAPLVQPDDARRETCTAPYQPDFIPYRVRARDTLARLLENSAFSPVTIAALNCLDDTVWLPIGAVIWLPADAAVVQTSESPPQVTPEATVQTLPGELTSAPDGGQAFVWEAAGAGRYSAITRCPNPWLNEMPAWVCPAEPARTLFMVWQPFERGMMIYRADTETILVLREGGEGALYPDTFVEGQPTPEAVALAPLGLYAPVRGFALIWEALGGEAALGWATAAEIGYDGATQPAGRTSYTTYWGAPTVVYAITQIPNSAVALWTRAESPG